MSDPTSVQERAARIKLLLMDCDGVLTDGSLMLLEGGDEQKSFNVRDGHGLVLFHRAGLRSGIISGRTARVVEWRTKDLGIEFVRQGSHNKISDFDSLLAEAGVSADETAFVGDDVTDIPLMKRCQLAVAVADAVPETRAAAHYVTQALGGHGAIRETVELILKAQGHWPELMKRYLND